MKIGKSDKLFSVFEVNGRRIVMSRNGINGAARPIKNCSRKDVYEAMADLYDEFYFKEIDTDKMISIDWILNNGRMPKDGVGRDAILDMIEDWRKENALD